MGLVVERFGSLGLAWRGPSRSVQAGSGRASLGASRRGSHGRLRRGRAGFGEARSGAVGQPWDGWDRRVRPGFARQSRLGAVRWVVVRHRGDRADRTARLGLAVVARRGSLGVAGPGTDRQSGSLWLARRGMVRRGSQGAARRGAARRGQGGKAVADRSGWAGTARLVLAWHGAQGSRGEARSNSAWRGWARHGSHGPGFWAGLGEASRGTAWCGWAAKALLGPAQHVSVSLCGAGQPGSRNG